MIKKRILAGMCSVLLCAMAHAGSADQDLTTLLLNITTLKANFVQTVKNKQSPCNKHKAKSLYNDRGNFVGKF